MALRISDYFSGIGAKRLSEVEISADISNQHEFNGIKEFKEIFGAEKIKLDTKFFLLSDEDEKIITADGNITWYDARERHETRTEYRLYYTNNLVMKNAAVGDLIIIGKTSSSTAIVIVAPQFSTIETQLLWLFNLSEIKDKFIVKDLSSDKQELGFAAKYILTEIGYDTDEKTGETFLELILKTFGNKFPTTNDFSQFARNTLTDISPVDEPDKTILLWMEREEVLFKTLEKHLVEEKLKSGFGSNGIDVDDFISFSLSVQNRRKSRAGFAFENHLSVIFDKKDIKYSRGKVTELNKKPDFVFPGINQYHNPQFNEQLLTMLGVKTSSKDRWRQISSEAARINIKHLITLEPSISKNQTNEMIADQVQLVIPAGIHETYTAEQRRTILTLSDFLKLVLDKQGKTL
jgi:hypothetical protein